MNLIKKRLISSTNQNNQQPKNKKQFKMTVANNMITVQDLDINNVTFTMNVDKTTKRKVFFVNHKKTSILLKTPKMYFPNGIKHWSSDAYPDSFELEMSFGEDKADSANNQLVQEFHSKMSQLDTLIKKQILENSMDWISKKKTSMEMIEESYYPKPIVRIPHDKEGNVLEYSHRMKVKLDRERNGNEFTGYFSSHVRNKTRVLAYDTASNNLCLREDNCEEVVNKGAKGVALIQLVNICVVGDKVYPKWKLVQVKVYKDQSNRIDGNVLGDDTESLASVPEETAEELAELEETVETAETVLTVENLELEDDLDTVPAPKKGRGKK